MIHNAQALVNVPSNKFFRPHIDEAQSLIRTHLISNRLPRKKSSQKAIVIEAQAGQGKTTLASQFLEASALDYIWYQIGPEDSDPFFVLTALSHNLKSKFPGFNSLQLGPILPEGQMEHHDIQRCANIIMHAIGRFSHEIYIVFDDVHLIENSCLTNNLIEHLLETSPPNLHFLLTSRHPLNIKGKFILNSQAVCYLKTDDLALTHLEIETLFNTILKQKICRQEAQDIQYITGGWIMGIMLTGDLISKRGKFWQTATNSCQFFPADHDRLIEYFQNEIFFQVPAALHIPFQKLAILSEIPADLALLITDIEDIVDILRKITRGNFFIYQLDDHTFRFHHFFQEFLQIRARQQLSQKVINHIHRCEAEYYLEREMIDKALLCYKKAGDYRMMENLLKEKGMGLVAHNKTLAILALLQTIPEDTLLKFGWLTLYAGLLRIDFTAQSTLRFFDTARANFIESGDETGEIIALSQTINYHFVVSGRYNLGAELLPRIEKLLLKNEADLDVQVKIMAANNLALGLCFFEAEMEKARYYCSVASALAAKYDLPDFTASSRFILGYIELLSGNISKFKKEAEACFPLLSNSHVGWPNKLTIRMMYLCYLSMIADQLNFSAEKQAVNTTIEKKALTETIVSPYLHVWGSSILFAAGKTDEAMERLNLVCASTASAATDHMHSQILQWQAFGHALHCENEAALTCINQSVHLRSKNGGPFHEAFNTIIAGAVYSRLGIQDFAEYSFAKGLEIAESIPSPFLLICAYMNQSFHKLVTLGPAAALDDLEIGLNLMKRHSFNHFWTWEPTMMIRLLALAVHNNIEKPFAGQLAKERLDVEFADTGDIIPLLHFSLLDNFQICIGSQVLYRASNFTPSQRDLLGLLLTTKGQRLSQERVQLELWPDRPPENARTSFDTLLTRLRKELSTNLPGPVKNYISLQKGILELSHAHIDTVNFTKMAAIGMQHSRNGEWWQAGNAFRTALSFWKGLWPEESFCIEETIVLTDQLLNTLLEITLIWAENLVKMDLSDEAVALLEQTLDTHFHDERLICLLYSLYINTHHYLKAGEMLDRYRRALEKLGYPAGEVEELLAENPMFSAKRMYDIRGITTRS